MLFFFRSGNTANTHGKAERQKIQLIIYKTEFRLYRNRTSNNELSIFDRKMAVLPERFHQEKPSNFRITIVNAWDY